VARSSRQAIEAPGGGARVAANIASSRSVLSSYGGIDSLVTSAGMPLEGTFTLWVSRTNGLENFWSLLKRSIK